MIKYYYLKHLITFYKLFKNNEIIDKNYIYNIKNEVQHRRHNKYSNFWL